MTTSSPPLLLSPAIAPPSREVDLETATNAARDLLRALGVDTESASTLRTPERMALALHELLTPGAFDLTAFAAEGYQQMAVVRDIPFVSVCEHHMLPFTGTAHLAYLPKESMLGLSKFARVVELFARRPQVQERLTQQIADFLRDHLQANGVGVLIRAEHSCMTLRGAQAAGSSTVTCALHGRLLEDASTRQEFMALAGVRA
ncbi:GTP cyclohydrolase I [Nocardiopsis sp. NPDC006198]|uniref:GTP cyclohydrolase I n=1 Tax=Nocardiopsis sp. NPDC006198 TaxID=3154472 RepID=UPI00339E3ADE